MKYKVVVVDDEPDAVQFLGAILADHCPELAIVGTAHSALEGFRVISHTQPDLVFLDVEMPQGSGFDMLRMFPSKSFDVVFVTAYNHYAIDAIRFSALDYILKPVSIREFLLAVNRFTEKRRAPQVTAESFATLFENLKNQPPKRLVISTLDGYEYLDTTEIVRIEAEGSYSRFHIAGGRKIVVSRPLREFHEILMNRSFFRPHNSHLINLDYVRKYYRNEASVGLADGSTIPISRAKKTLFVELMNSLSCKGCQSEGEK